jgi:hypothetical protein
MYKCTQISSLISTKCRKFVTYLIYYIEIHVNDLQSQKVLYCGLKIRHDFALNEQNDSSGIATIDYVSLFIIGYDNKTNSSQGYGKSK